MLEQFEEVVEDWYFHHQDQRLENFLCQNHVLETSDQGGGQPPTGCESTPADARLFFSSQNV